MSKKIPEKENIHKNGKNSIIIINDSFFFMKK